MSKGPISKDSKSLEDEFFARESARLLQKGREDLEAASRRQALRKVISVVDETLLDDLLALGIGPENALALRLIPLIFVAWADGSMDEQERRAILNAAAEQGLDSEEGGAQLLRDWLESKPEPGMLDLWKRYAGELVSSLTPGEREKMRAQVLGAATQVAEAAGGFLGLKTKISAAERKVLEDLEAVFG